MSTQCLQGGTEIEVVVAEGRVGNVESLLRLGLHDLIMIVLVDEVVDQEVLLLLFLLLQLDVTLPVLNGALFITFLLDFVAFEK